MINLFFLLITIIIATSFGNFFLKKLKFKDISALEQNIISCSLGLFFIAYITFFLGCFGLLYKWIFFLLITLLLFLFIKENISLIKWGIKSSVIKVNNFTPFLFFGISFFLTLFLANSPSIYWDELHYHLTVPKIYINSGKIVEIKEIIYSNFPKTIEMLYLYCMLISNDILPNFLHWFFGVLTAATIFVIGRRFYNQDFGILAGTMFYTAPVVLTLSPISYIDLAVSLYIILSFYLIILWDEKKHNNYLYLSYIFCGIAFSAKHSAVICSILLNLFVLYKFIKHRQRFFLVIKIIFLCNLMCFLIPSVWYLKNIYYTGNPVYPFFYNIFGGKGLDKETSMEILKSITEFGGKGKGVKEFILLPWNLTVHGINFSNLISPIYLSLIPFLIFFKNDKFTKLFAFFGGGYLIIWFFFTQQMRFLIPSIAMLSLVVCFIIYKIEQISIKTYYIILSFLFFSFVFNISLYFFISSFKMRTAFGMQSKESFLAEKFNMYSACQYINKKLPKNSYIFFINDNRVYYCDKKFLIFSPLTKNFTISSSEKRYKNLKNIGVTHIILNTYLCHLSRDACLMLVDDRNKNYIKEVFVKNGVWLFKIN